MIASCAATNAAPSLARDILASTDCLIGERIQAGFAALLAPGGSFAQALTIALTIYVAVFAYRLLLGLSSLTLADLVPHFIKIGVILALVTSWPSYQVLVFDLLFRGPEQLANAITRQVSDTSAAGQGDVLGALQAVFDRMTDHAGDAWAQVTTVAPTALPAAPVAPVLPGTPPAPTQIALPFQLGAAQFVAMALWLAALVMMAASVGVLLVARIILALLLVLGPIFIAFALFAPTRGLFEGWLRTTVKFAVVPLFTLPFTAALVAVLIPFVATLDDTPIESFRDGPALAILAITFVFAAVLFQAVRLAGSIAGGLRLPRGRAPVALPIPAPVTSPLAVLTPYTAPSRAEILVQSMAGSSGRDGRSTAIATGALQTTRMVDSLAAPAAADAGTGNRLGQGHRRLVITSAATPRRGGA